MVTTLPAKSSPTKVVDTLTGLTDGSFEVVAVEVYDHPLAEHVKDGTRWGGDGGPTTLGFWVLGTDAEVHQYINEHGWESFEEQYAVGGE